MVAKAHDTLAEVSATGQLQRTASAFREIISPDHPVYQPEPQRYHLYISYACPWANRCLAVLRMKGLEQAVSFTAVHPTWQRTRPADEQDAHCGWAFYDSSTGSGLKSSAGYGLFHAEHCSPDPANAPPAQFVRDLYELSGDTQRKYSVPVLWDKRTRTIVNNESSEILRMLNSQFDAFAVGPFAQHDFFPPALQREIDALNEWVYADINDGVYRCGFAQSQSAYDEAVERLFSALDRVDELLSKSRFLAGNHLTEADIRLFMTLVRFDEVYVVYFKCNVRRVADYEHIRLYMRDLYQIGRAHV